jgi:dCMP deaminase
MNIKHNPPIKQKWIDAFMDTAERFAQLSTAKRLQVGSVVVKDNRIISIGYNGTPAGWDNTCEYSEFVGSDEQIPSPGEMKRLGFTGTDHGWWRTHTKDEVIHAEANAIAKLARSNESGLGGTMFVTHAPCIDCAKLIYGAGVEKVYYRHTYRETTGIDFLSKCGVTTEQV